MHGCIFKTGLIGLTFGMLVFLPAGCRQSATASANAPLVRVRLMQNLDQVVLTAAQPPILHASSDRSAHRLKIPGGSNVLITLAPHGWQAGGIDVGAGDELHIKPAFDGSLRVNGQAYRGSYRLVSVGPGRFDLMNDVDIDSYLKGVISKELLSRWDEEAYKAQAIAARTYAMYEISSVGQSRSWHVYDDTRSQVYGGIAAETAKSIKAVDETAGVVLAYGPPGREKIFKAYFSACCGGIGQSGADALGEPDIPPLMARNVGALCNASNRFNWPAVVFRKDELTRRVRAWGMRKNRPEKDIAALDRLEIAQVNQFGRPVRFVFTDVRGAQYSLSGEETRWAINADANGGQTILSSFFKPINESDVIRLMDGHGWGHGVGLCQWCAQTWAERGARHEQILRASYPGSVLVRAY